jgi:hypothetical protein
MSVLHHTVLMFFFVQFVTVIAAMLGAMVFANPEFSLPSLKPSRRAITRNAQNSKA